MKVIVFDTETTSLEKPFAYNIGYVVMDTDTCEILQQRDYVVEQVWHNPMLFTTAYYADKRDLYVSRMRGKTCKLEKFGYIMQQIYRDIQSFEIECGFAYNSPFDVSVFAFNCDWFKCINPIETLPIYDIRGYVHKFIAFTPAFQEYCDKYALYTESGNYSTTAEAVYRYVSGIHDFNEEHTALADSIIEAHILGVCVGLGAEWATAYKVYRTIPRKVPKTYTVVDSEGNKHIFPYTTKRKINGGEGVKLMFKQ